MQAEHMQNAPLTLKKAVKLTVHVDCSQSPYFSVGFSRLVGFDGTAAILRECDRPPSVV